MAATMLEIAMREITSLFDDEQRLLNRVWMVLLGLQAVMVVFGAVSAVVQACMRRRRWRRWQQSRRVKFDLSTPPSSPRSTPYKFVPSSPSAKV